MSRRACPAPRASRFRFRWTGPDFHVIRGDVARASMTSAPARQGKSPAAHEPKSNRFAHSPSARPKEARCDPRMKGKPVRFRLAQVTLGIYMLISAIDASPCIAQTRVTSLEELRATLAAGDLITIVPADGQPVIGRLTRLGEADLDLRVVNKRTPQERGSRSITMPVDAIQSLERRRDSVRNGAAIGAGIGAGFGAAMFTYAFVIDRNEVDEWAPLYAGAAVVYTGIGMLIGWAIDAASSKPHITFEQSSKGKTKVSVQPLYLRGRGIALAVSF